MSALQDRIDDEIKNLAAAVIIDEVRHDKEFSGQDKCKKSNLIQTLTLTRFITAQDMLKNQVQL